MNDQDLKINIIPFSPVNQCVELFFFKEERQDYASPHLSEYPLELAGTYQTDFAIVNPDGSYYRTERKVL